MEDAGWRLTEEGKILCDGSVKKALDLDIRDIGAECLPEDINRGKAEVLEGAFVLQISKVRNVSAPKANEESQGAPRMLKISMTDGKITIHGVEVSKIDGISINTPPGTKIKLSPRIPVSNGLLRLEAGSLKVLGGRVEVLVEKWETSQKMAKFTRNFARNRQISTSNDFEGPPAWIAFGKKVKTASQLPEADKNFKALPTAVPDANAKEANAEFNSQRQDAIKEAAKAGSQKVFGGGTKEIKEGKVSDNRRNGSKKFGGRENNENNEDQRSKVNGFENNEHSKDSKMTDIRNSGSKMAER
jgi:tudor domain-containing protein 3